jgi:SET domain-containing protein
MGKVVVKESSIHGMGLFAGEKIRKDDIILQIDDSRVVDEKNPLKPELNEQEHHCDYLAGGKVVLLKPPERYVNHSCNPNAYIKWIEGKRYIIARRSLKYDEEICVDYCIDGTGDVEWTCNCSSKDCRKEIYAEFFHLPLGKQIEYFDYLSQWYIDEHAEEYEFLKRTIHRLKKANKIS